MAGETASLVRVEMRTRGEGALEVVRNENTRVYVRDHGRNNA